MLARRMLALAVGLLLQLATVATGADESASEGFRVVSSKTAERLERLLRQSAEQGFRVVSAGRGVAVDGAPRFVALLEPSAGSAADYAVLSGPGDLRQREALHARGAEGYRLLPDGVLVQPIVDFWLPPSAYDDQTIVIMERTDSVHGFEYGSTSFGRHDDLYRELIDRREQGWRIVGMWNSGRRLQVVFERPLAADHVGAVIEGEQPYRLLIMATRKVLKGKLKSAASKGYRVIASADPSTMGPPILLLERGDPSQAPIDYRFVGRLEKRLRKDKLERKLNKRTRKGWRVTPSGVTDRTLTLERVSGKSWDGAYLTLSSKRAPGLPRGLAQAATRGFRPIRTFVEPGETTVLLERAPD